MDQMPHRRMEPTPAARWLLFLTALFIVAAWPPQTGRSLLVKGVNWAADPSGTLPALPPQLGFGLGDDVRAVEERDALVRRYDDALAQGEWMRTRLKLKEAHDPFDPVTTRQLLLVVGVVVAFIAVRPSRDRRE
jgi:hypothetical protein